MEEKLTCVKINRKVKKRKEKEKARLATEWERTQPTKGWDAKWKLSREVHSTPCLRLCPCSAPNRMLSRHLLTKFGPNLVEDVSPDWWDILPNHQRWYAKWKLSWNMHTLHTRFCTFGTDLHAPSVLSNKTSASELSRKLIKSALLVGYGHSIYL